MHGLKKTCMYKTKHNSSCGCRDATRASTRAASALPTRRVCTNAPVPFLPVSRACGANTGHCVIVSKYLNKAFWLIGSRLREGGGSAFVDIVTDNKQSIHRLRVWRRGSMPVQGKRVFLGYGVVSTQRTSSRDPRLAHHEQPQEAQALVEPGGARELVLFTQTVCAYAKLYG